MPPSLAPTHGGEDAPARFIGFPRCVDSVLCIPKGLESFSPGLVALATYTHQVNVLAAGNDKGKLRWFVEGS
jgi:hypothetical protein